MNYPDDLHRKGWVCPVSGETIDGDNANNYNYHTANHNNNHNRYDDEGNYSDNNYWPADPDEALEGDSHDDDETNPEDKTGENDKKHEVAHEDFDGLYENDEDFQYPEYLAENGDEDDIVVVKDRYDAEDNGYEVDPSNPILKIHSSLTGMCPQESNDFISTFRNMANFHEKQTFPDDSNYFLNKRVMNGVTKRQFAQRLESIAGFNNLSNSCINQILSLLSDSIPHLNLPIARKTNGKKCKHVVNNIGRYTDHDKNNYPIQVCTNNCIAYHGKRRLINVPISQQQFNRTHNHIEYDGDTNNILEEVDCSTLIACPFCAQPRFTRCNKPTCQDKDHLACNPFFPAEPKPGKHPVVHSILYRFPMKTMYYRSIIVKLMEMYKFSLSPNNKEFLNYHLLRNRVFRKDCVFDINDGIAVVKKMEDMHDKFLVEQKRHAEVRMKTNLPVLKLKECSLGLTLFYDGKPNFTRHVDSMWPLLCSVINCNPSDRTKLGVGMFLTALHNLSPGSKAEQYLMDTILISELKALQDGMIFEFEYTLANGKIRQEAVFLQANLIYFHLDTQALQKVARIKGSGSLKGCSLCNTLHGTQRKEIDKVIYNGERSKLDAMHDLRYIGQDTLPPLNKPDAGAIQLIQIDEKNFYDGTTDHKASFDAATLDNRTLKQLRERVDVLHLPKPHYSLLEHRMNIDLAPQYHDNHWVDEAFPLSLFIDYLYYHCRHRGVKTEYERISTAEYKRCGEQAEMYREIEERKIRRVPLKKEKSFTVNGVHAVAPYVRELNFMFEAFGFDMMHYGKNAGAYFFKIFKGERGLDDKIRRSSVGLNIFPVLKYKGLDPPWKLTKTDQIYVDSVANCLLVPSGYKNDHKIRFPMKTTSFMNAKDHMNWMTSYASYVYSFTSMASGYQHFVARFARDLCSVLNPCIVRSDLPHIIDCIQETRAIQEGLFPESEAVFCFHQIIDIVYHIQQFGHVRSLGCWFGERALSTIAANTPRGGMSYIDTLYRKYMAKEMSIPDHIKDAKQFMNNNGIYSDFVLRISGSQTKHSLNAKEKGCLLHTIVKFLEEDNPLEFEALIFRSNTYRLYRVFQIYQTSHISVSNERLGMDFFDWISALNKAYMIHKCAFNELECFVVTKGYVHGIVNDVTSNNEVINFNAITKSGLLLLSDFTKIIADLMNFNPSISTKVTIKGIAFNCRGTKFSEKQAKPQMLFNGKWRSGVDENNLLNKYWDHKKHCSSWFRVKDTDSAVWFGQFNYVFRLVLNNDQLINGLAFGNVAVRTPTYDPVRRHYFIDNVSENSYDGNRTMVCLNDVDSTAIMLSALNANTKPIATKSSVGVFHHHEGKKTDYKLCIAPRNDSVLNKLYLLELFPERLKFQYGSIMIDADGTKTFEIA
jgi:hypothetical protein